jgi:thiol-disulfide isomerase/thioredoxin
VRPRTEVIDMKARTTRVAVLLLVGLLALTGCAVATDAAAPSATSAMPGEASTTPDSMTPAPTEGAETDPAISTPPAPAEGAYLEYSDDAIEATPGMKALFFHASWCPKCRALDEDLRAQGAPDGLTVFKVDYDSRTDLRQKYGVTIQTTIVFVDDAGEAISSTVLYDDPSVESLAAAVP